MQWQISTDNGRTFRTLTDGSEVTGSTTTTLTISSFAAAGSTEYQAIVTDANGVISTSNAATLTINPDSTATVLLTSASSVSFGQPTTLTATVTPGSSGPDTATGSVVFSDQGT